MCLCVTLAQLSLYSSIWDANFGLIIGSGASNGVKFDITNPHKITKIAKSSSLRQESLVRVRLADFYKMEMHFILLQKDFVF